MTQIKKSRDSREDPGSAKLELIIEHDQIPGFFQFLQKGILVRAHLGSSVNEFLSDQLGMKPSYVEERVQTCFLDGMVVDDMNSGLIQEGASLSLSGAMPGLLGATLRKGGYYASMRSQISYRKGSDTKGSGMGYVLLKLFNLIIREVGPDLFARGAWVESKDLEDFFRKQGKVFKEKLKEASLNGEIISWDRLTALSECGKWIFLRIRVH